jgi:hypothetical protein
MPEPELPPQMQATLEALHARLDQIEARMDDLDRSRGFFRNLGWAKLALSALTAGMVGFWTPVLAVMAVVQGPVPGVAWLIGLGGGCMLMAKDLRSQLDLPPAAVNGGLAFPKPKVGP